MNKFIKNSVIFICIPLVIILALHSVINKRFNFVSMIIVFLSCIPFYLRYENRKPHAREIVVLSVMITLTILSRVVFALTPGFKPMGAFIIICGMVFGKESGFLCGSLSAFVSNIFFGQGPWTPFQMLAFGLIGYFAGLFNTNKYLEKKGLLIIYGIVAGIIYSLFMDIWTVLSIDQVFHIYRYVAVIATSIPFMVLYVLSNVIFLLILTPMLLHRFERIKCKYGFVSYQ